MNSYMFKIGPLHDPSWPVIVYFGAIGKFFMQNLTKKYPRKKLLGGNLGREM